PDAKFRRYHNASTYETLLTHYKLGDKHLVYIGKIIHDIEVNVWEKKILPETRMVQQAVIEIITSSDTSDVIISRSMAYFDGLYEELKRRNPFY
ncbi:MAG: chromate resistance protein, partial [Deltaproteobacteria bacterium]|nr:chromate resistance protein [Deltaproteobacteria bacterium]